MKKFMTAALVAAMAMVGLANEWDTERTIFGMVSDDDGAVGVTEVKLGKRNSYFTATVSGRLTVKGKGYSIKKTKIVAADQPELSVKIGKLGIMHLTISEDGSYSGTVGRYSIESVQGDGSWEEGDELSFSASEIPDEIAGYAVMSDFAPDGVPVAVGKRLKLTTPKAATPKWSKTDEAFVAQVKVDGELVDSENPSSLKLSYNRNTGRLSGSFKLFTETKKETKLKSYTMKITGFVSGSTGMGVAYNAKCGSVAFTLE